MAKKIQAWTELSPHIVTGGPITEEDPTENIVNAANQSKGSALAELDLQTKPG